MKNRPMHINPIIYFSTTVLSFFSVSFAGIEGFNHSIHSDHIFSHGASGIITGQNELPIYENPALLGSERENSLKYTISVANDNKIINSILYRPQSNIGTFSLLYDSYQHKKSNFSRNRNINSNRILAIGWGHSSPVFTGSHSIGINLCYNFTPQSDKLKSNALCINFGYLLRFWSDLQLGLIVKSLAYLDLSKEDSINVQVTGNFQIGTGIGYVRTFTFKSDKRWLKISPEFTLNRIIFKASDTLYDFNAFNMSISTDLFFINTAGVNFAFNFGINGKATILPEFKINLLNHLSMRFFPLDYSIADLTYGNEPWVLGITAYNLLEWKKTDLRWWLVDRKN
ncbi:MAG TPA: hypothetical protein VHO70_08090 [Chitinispirillaceae bacterium]|nr:hypothetical protein [Chitinispirillaceae bacterium]